MSTPLISVQRLIQDRPLDTPAPQRGRTISEPKEHYDSFRVPDLIERLERHYKKRLDSKAIQANTHRTKLQSLRVVRAWWAGYGPAHDYEITRFAFDNLLAYARAYKTRAGKPLAPMSIYEMLGALRAPLNGLYRDSLTAHINIADWVPVIPKPEIDRDFPTLEEIEKIVYAPINFKNIESARSRRLRDTAIICFMISTACRIYEMSNAQVGDLEFMTPLSNLNLGDDHSGRAYLRKVKGDSDGLKNKGRYVVFCGVAGLLAKCVIRSLREWENGQPVNARLFGVSEFTYSKHIRKYADIQGMHRFTSHSGRRAAATDFIEKNGAHNQGVMQDQMGHTNNSLIRQAYIDPKVLKRALADEVERLHVSPLDDLDLSYERFWCNFPVSYDP